MPHRVKIFSVEMILTHDPAEFSTQAADFLAGALERNHLATTLVNAQTGHYGPAPPTFLAGLDAGGQTAAVAMRTPPWPMLVVGFASDADADAMLDLWLEHDGNLTGVGGEPDTARRIAAAWAKRTGGQTELSFSEAMHSLTEVIDPPRAAPGALRLATLGDRGILIDWERGFAQDTGMLPGVVLAPRVDQRLAAGRQMIWDDRGPVCTVAFSVAVAGAARIGPVYTPPEHRGRGYASSAVAAVSRQLLDEGARRCMLFTDLANPTSNRIYASIGYVRFADWDQYRFSRTAGSPVSSRTSSPGPAA